MSALFVRAMDDDAFVNLARCTSIRVAKSRHVPDWWVVLAHFAQRTTVVGTRPSEQEAWELATSLAARANVGGH